MSHTVTRRGILHAALLASIAPMLGDRAFAAAPPFPPDTTAEQATEGLDLRGRTAVVTGCNSGIGLEIMRVLALRGAHVIGTARSIEKGREACTSIEGKTTPVVLDLGDFDSVVACSREIVAFDVPIDMLVCNAGIVLGDHQTLHGLETQFVVNHLGHFLLTQRLLDRVGAAPQGRVVVLGSGDHRRAPPGGIQFDALSGEGWHERGYSHSKLANGLFSLELARRLRDTSATSNCVSPGHVRTNILRNVGNGYGAHARTVQQGAATPCYVACHPAMAGVSGGFFRDFVPAEQSAEQRDAAMAKRLWTVSEDLVRAWLA